MDIYFYFCVEMSIYDYIIWMILLRIKTLLHSLANG